jgi:hypothetical protein
MLGFLCRVKRRWHTSRLRPPRLLEMGPDPVLSEVTDCGTAEVNRAMRDSLAS